MVLSTICKILREKRKINLAVILMVDQLWYGVR